MITKASSKPARPDPLESHPRGRSKRLPRALEEYAWRAVGWGEHWDALQAKRAQSVTPSQNPKPSR